MGEVCAFLQGIQVVHGGVGESCRGEGQPVEAGVQTIGNLSDPRPPLGESHLVDLFLFISLRLASALFVHPASTVLTPD